MNPRTIFRVVYGAFGLTLWLTLPMIEALIRPLRRTDEGREVQGC